ncbi:MAG: glycine cleavage system protein GcvH [Halobacteria archaeon]
MSSEVPGNLRYLASHEWIDPETGKVGITDHAQEELGDVVFVELPGEGDEVTAEGKFGVVESIKAVSDVYSPVDGEVVDTNAEVESKPELVNEDPYGDGWLIEVETDSGLDHLLTADEYTEETD